MWYKEQRKPEGCGEGSESRNSHSQWTVTDRGNSVRQLGHWICSSDAQSQRYGFTGIYQGKIFTNKELARFQFYMEGAWESPLHTNKWKVNSLKNQQFFSALKMGDTGKCCHQSWRDAQMQEVPASPGQQPVQGQEILNWNSWIVGWLAQCEWHWEWKPQGTRL